MAQIRALMVKEQSTDPTAANYVVNTLYFDTDLGTDFDQLGDDLLALWVANTPDTDAHDRLRCKLYDMADAEPRLPRYNEVAALPGVAAPGPREVCLCLSYYAGTNTPRRRGRLYIGPWSNQAMTERPTTTPRNLLAGLAEALSDLGGANVQWVQYSPTTGDFTNVTNYWIDDEWDTQRSRGLEGTTRTTGTVDG